MQLLVRLLKYFLSNFKFILPTKSFKKPPSKDAQKNSNSFFFLLPKRHKQKDLCSKMWLIDQMYIELGFDSSFYRIKLCFLFPMREAERGRFSQSVLCKRCTTKLLEPRYKVMGQELFPFSTYSTARQGIITF